MSNDATASVVVVGSANVDLTVRVAELPRPGETSMARSLVRGPGGKGANQAVAAARAGGHVAFVGAVGRDPDGEMLERALEAEGIDTHLRRVDAATGTAIIAVDDVGENHILVVPGANLDVDASLVDASAELLEEASVVLTQLEVAPGALNALVGRGLRVVLNPAPGRRLARSDLRVDVCVPNAGELADLLGHSNRVPETPQEAIAAARRLHGPRAVVVTMGSDGAVVVEGDRSVHLPAPVTADVADTTAAGDTLCGYLATAMAEGATLTEAAHLGVNAASISVTRAGAMLSIPRRADLHDDPLGPTPVAAKSDD